MIGSTPSPGVAERPSISIRRHDFDIDRLKQLVDLGTINEPLHHLLKAMVLARFNIIVAGGTGAGKTTFMRCLINEIPADERLITVEDSLEVGLDHFADLHPDHVELEARPANVEGVGAVTMNDLAINALRMNPDRLIVGEVRGEESLTLLLACTQGNDGSMCTVHADSSEGVFGRLQMYLAMTRERFDPAATNLMVSQGIDAIVHVAAPRATTGSSPRSGRSPAPIVTWCRPTRSTAPTPTGRAEPRFPFSPDRLARLEAGRVRPPLARAHRDGWEQLMDALVFAASVAGAGLGVLLIVARRYVAKRSSRPVRGRTAQRGHRTTAVAWIALGWWPQSLVVLAVTGWPVAGAALVARALRRHGSSAARRGRDREHRPYPGHRHLDRDDPRQHGRRRRASSRHSLPRAAVARRRSPPRSAASFIASTT